MWNIHVPLSSSRNELLHSDLNLQMHIEYNITLLLKGFEITYKYIKLNFKVKEIKYGKWNDRMFIKFSSF